MSWRTCREQKISPTRSMVKLLFYQNIQKRHLVVWGQENSRKFFILDQPNKKEQLQLCLYQLCFLYKYFKEPHPPAHSKSLRVGHEERGHRARSSPRCALEIARKETSDRVTFLDPAVDVCVCVFAGSMVFFRVLWYFSEVFWSCCSVFWCFQGLW